MIPRFTADEPVALHALWRDDDDPTLLERIPRDARLVKTLPPRAETAFQHPKGQYGAPTPPHADRAVRLTRRIGKKRDRVRLVAKRARLRDGAVADQYELGAERPYGLLQRTKGRNLFPAEQASEMSYEHEDRCAFRP